MVGSRMSRSEQALLDTDDLEPNISLWAKRPLRFGAVYKAALRRSRNITVYLGANATEIVLNAQGDSVDELRTATLGGKSLSVRARRFVLACGGLENARLLLVSRSVQKSGVGNNSDVVGRFYMDHPRAVFGTVRVHGTQTWPLLLGVALRDGMGQVGIELSEAVRRKEQLLNNYLSLERRWSPQIAKSYDAFIRSMKILLRRGYPGKRLAFSSANLARIPDSIYLLAPRTLMPHALYRVLKAARDTLGRNVTELGIINHCEQVPNRESRVYLGEERDRLNMNRLVLDWKVGREETRTLVRLQQLLDLNLRRAGIGYVATDPNRHDDISYSDAAHHIGTTRMSESRNTGVVDRDCKVHGVRNLFIAGSSVFPTCGHANPTWTIVALALRLADRLKQIS
jgi:choline dehydrogenase-like flavoprotein